MKWSIWNEAYEMNHMIWPVTRPNLLGFANSSFAWSRIYFVWFWKIKTLFSNKIAFHKISKFWWLKSLSTLESSTSIILLPSVASQTSHAYWWRHTCFSGLKFGSREYSCMNFKPVLEFLICSETRINGQCLNWLKNWEINLRSKWWYFTTTCFEETNLRIK